MSKIPSLLAIVLSLTFACSGAPSKSPLFAPGEIVTISGIYLNADSTPLINAKIKMQNLRRFGYIDHTQAVINSIVDIILTITFFPFYDIVTDYDPRDQIRQAPGYFLTDVQTDNNGRFSFSINNDLFLRDAAGGINIVLINDDSSNSNKFGKFNLVVQEKDTDLGTIQLCDSPLSITEGAASINITWDKPPLDLAKYVLNVGDAADRSLIWSQDVAETENSLDLPKSLFGTSEVLVAIEAYYTLNEQLTSACLYPPQGFRIANPKPSIADSQIAEASGIQFKVDSLSNGKFNDPIYFEAFGTRSIDLDLPNGSEVSRIVLHNLKLRESGDLTVFGYIEGGEVINLGSYPEQRFMVIDLNNTTTLDAIGITFNSTLVDLQEISIH